MRQFWEAQIQLAVPVVLRNSIMCHQQAAAVCRSLCYTLEIMSCTACAETS